MGSKSDWGVMSAAVETLKDFGIENEVRIISAHRTPDLAADFARNAAANGIGVIIAGAGGAAHLGGVIAAMTNVPVIGVPIRTQTMGGLDSLLSIVQMPSGIPVARRESEIRMTRSFPNSWNVNRTIAPWIWMPSQINSA